MSRPAKYANEAERLAARRERERAAYHAMTPEQRAAIYRPKNAAQQAKRPKRPRQSYVIHPSRSRTLPVPQKHRAQTVEEFLAQGGRIERVAMGE